MTVRIVATFAGEAEARGFLEELSASSCPASWRRSMVRSGAVVTWEGDSLVARRVAGAFQGAGAPVDWKEV